MAGLLYRFAMCGVGDKGVSCVFEDMKRPIKQAAAFVGLS
jgi:hypothetical protein